MVEQEQGPKVTWKDYKKWEGTLSKQERRLGKVGQWPEGTPQVFIDLKNRLTPEELVLSAIFDEEVPIEDVLARPEKEPTDPVKYEALKEQMLEVLASPTGLERQVLRLRFGLEDGRSRTLKQVGEEIGKSRSTAGRIEKRALNKLRHPSRSPRLKDFLA